MIDVDIKFHISLSQKFSEEDPVPICAKHGVARGYIGRFEKVPVCSSECSCFRYGKCGCEMAKYDKDSDQFFVGEKCPLYPKAMVCIQHVKEIYRRIEIMENL